MHSEHKRDQKVSVGFAVLTTSDSRTEETDETGKIAKSLIEGENHQVLAYNIVKNNAKDILEHLSSYITNPDIRVIITSGGTGVGSRDVTVRAIQSEFEKPLIGFGELFRRLSFDEIGVAGIYSRATAGLIGSTVVYCLPGSKNAVRTALTKIILPGLGHLIWEIDR